ncbi:MAG: T9SS type A sorting domain-containing protein [Bacteroidia bacterium]|nr:T9SS type A sorting domain-containing protein [Bacteroidia bacterium]
MNRRNVFKNLAAIGVGTMLPFSKAAATSLKILSASRLPKGLSSVDCVLVPSETRGPYPLDLSSNTSMFRQAINETKTGVPFTLKLNLVNINNDCAPIPSARVDVWHCDKDGVYSGYQQPGANTVGQTFCRGIQLTDANGQVTFTTVYPGWYAGRITHIHFEIYLNSVLSVTSQVAFPQTTTSEVYNSTLYAAKGQNTSVTSFAQDNVFSDGTTDQMLTITGDITSGFTGELTVGVAASTTGLFKLEPETGGQFTLGQNYPNPFSEKTTIPFSLTHASKVTIELYGVNGQKITTLLKKDMNPGEQTLEISRFSESLNLPNGNYAYQIIVENNSGVFRQSKLLSAW